MWEARLLKRRKGRAFSGDESNKKFVGRCESVFVRDCCLGGECGKRRGASADRRMMELLGHGEGARVI